MNTGMKLRWVGGTVSTAALALTLVLATGSPRPQDVPTTPSDDVAADARAGGPHEGIKVHGHWTLEVRDPDGTVREKRDFENALMTSGKGFLASLLGREATNGFWMVHLISLDSPCKSEGTPNQPCRLVEQGDPLYVAPAAWKFPTLTLLVLGDALVLTGSATALSDGSIEGVNTVVRAGGSPTLFTLTDIPPLTVLAGQSILVTVTLSFS